MSRTTRTTMRVRIPTADQLLMRAIVRSCRGLHAVPIHSRLAVLARERRTADLAELERRAAAVAAEPAIAIAAREANQQAWTEAQRLLEESRSALAASPTRANAIAARGDAALRNALESAAQALAVEERTLATSVMDQALQSIGCRTTVAVGSGASGIWAERGDHLVAVRIEDGGEVELDHAGCDGDHCAPFHQEIEAAVAAHGGAFEDAEVVEHGDAEGGALIRGAARVAGPRGDMARAIAEQGTAAQPERFAGDAERRLPRAQRIGNRSGS